MSFLWDESKNSMNKQKHGLSFELAQYVFQDDNIICWADTRKDYGEERWIGLDEIENIMIVVVVYTIRSDRNNEQTLRIISARKASRKERQKYHELTNLVTTRA